MIRDTTVEQARKYRVSMYNQSVFANSIGMMAVGCSRFVVFLILLAQYFTVPHRPYHTIAPKPCWVPGGGGLNDAHHPHKRKKQRPDLLFETPSTFYTASIYHPLQTHELFSFCRIRIMNRILSLHAFILLLASKLDFTLSFGVHPSFCQNRIKSSNKKKFNLKTASTSDEQSPEDQIPDINFLDNSRPDTEQRPSRIQKRNGLQKKQIEKTTFPPVENKFNQEWGVETIDDPSQRPMCPNSLEEVADAAFYAISSTLYCQQNLDPNIVSNAMAVSVTDKRPVGFAYWPAGRDVGRLGIEIDGARHLLTDHSRNMNQHKTNDSTPQRDLGSYDIANSISGRMATPREYEQQTIALEGRALRRLSLVLASQLSQGPWSGLEDMDDSEKDAKFKSRPVALFFNTIRQALLASKELQLLQKIAKLQKRENQYDNIRILCLGQDEIPKDMIKELGLDTNGKRRRKWGGSKELSEGVVNPKNGLILIVQPTDFNNEANPASPVIGTVQQLQTLVAKASIAHLPSVVIAPRLTEQFDGNGIEQSGYQKSSTYGGLEVSSMRI